MNTRIYLTADFSFADSHWHTHTAIAWMTSNHMHRLSFVVDCFEIMEFAEKHGKLLIVAKSSIRRVKREIPTCSFYCFSCCCWQPEGLSACKLCHPHFVWKWALFRRNEKEKGIANWQRYVKREEYIIILKMDLLALKCSAADATVASACAHALAFTNKRPTKTTHERRAPSERNAK